MDYEFYLLNYFDKKSLPKARDFVIVTSMSGQDLGMNT